MGQEVSKTMISQKVFQREEKTDLRFNEEKLSLSLNASSTSKRSHM